MSDIQIEHMTEQGINEPGGGYDPIMPIPVTRRASTAAAAHLYPWWGAGGGAPTIGAPVGYTNKDGRWSAMHCDPYSYFAIAKYISSAGQMVIGLNGRGKSTYIKRICTVYDAWEILNVVLPDVKGEYVGLISRMAPKWTGNPKGIPGQVITLGRGRGSINPLDMGDAASAAAAISGKGEKELDANLIAAGAQLLLDAKLRRRLFVEALFTAQDGTEPSGFEVTLLGKALSELDRVWMHKHPPILSDLLAVFEKPPLELKRAAGWRDDIDRYWAEVDHIVKTLVSLTGTDDDLGLGDVFNRQSSVQWRRDTHVVVDIHGVHKEDRALRGALQVGSWITGFGQIAVSHALSDAGLEKFRRYHAVQDEMWDAFTTGRGMVERHNKLTRLDRHEGLITTKCTHSLGDNKMLSEEDQLKALGMVQRTPLLVCFALDPSEADFLREIAAFTDAEIDYLVALSTPKSYSAPVDARPPGNGCAAMKLNGRPMVPFEMKLADTERSTADTNQRWTA